MYTAKGFSDQIFQDEILVEEEKLRRAREEIRRQFCRSQDTAQAKTPANPVHTSTHTDEATQFKSEYFIHSAQGKPSPVPAAGGLSCPGWNNKRKGEIRGVESLQTQACRFHPGSPAEALRAAAEALRAAAACSSAANTATPMIMASIGRQCSLEGFLHMGDNAESSNHPQQSHESVSIATPSTHVIHAEYAYQNKAMKGDKEKGASWRVHVERGGRSRKGASLSDAVSVSAAFDGSSADFMSCPLQSYRFPVKDKLQVARIQLQQLLHNLTDTHHRLISDPHQEHLYEHCQLQRFHLPLPPTRKQIEKTRACAVPQMCQGQLQHVVHLANLFCDPVPYTHLMHSAPEQVETPNAGANTKNGTPTGDTSIIEGGIGVLLGFDVNANCIVEDLVIDGPAHTSGKIKQEDRILFVDGIAVTGLSLEQVSSLFVGPAGSPVFVAIDNKSTVRTVEVIRARVEVPLEEAPLPSSPWDQHHTQAETVPTMNHSRLPLRKGASVREMRDYLLGIEATNESSGPPKAALSFYVQSCNAIPFRDRIQHKLNLEKRLNSFSPLWRKQHCSGDRRRIM